MSSFNMAMRNIKKCVSDYLVYFLTLIVGVAIFYVFNSVGDQNVVRKIAGSQYEIVDFLLLVLEVVSVAVAFVLGFLIIYANQFLIRRRKKEFGIYMLLGMGKKDISKILVNETVLIGAFSLVVGLVIGIFFSHFMSILVGKIFEADMSSYSFTVSTGALIKTVVNFVVMYVVVLLFHSVTLAKYQLIDLLTAAKKTEKQIIKNPIIASIVFVISIVALGIAYYRVGFCTEDMNRNELITHIVIGIISTLLFFWSLSGFLLTVFRSWKGMYHSNLNSFVIRQFCNSINSSSITMGIICLMLFVTICTFSSGFSVAHELQSNVRELTPVSYSIKYNKNKSIKKIIKKQGLNPNEWIGENNIEVPFYNCKGVTWASGLGNMIDAVKEQFPAAKWDTPETIMSLSDYNRLAMLYKKECITLKENEFAVLCDFYFFQEIRNQSLKNGNSLKVGDFELVPAKEECIEGYFVMSANNMNLGVLIVPDAVVEQSSSGIKVAGRLMVGDYITSNQKEREVLDQKLLDVTKSLTEFDYSKKNPLPAMTVGTQISIRSANNSGAMMVTFIVIYIGIVFLISSAALLALKALSESIDSEGKYMILRKIGSNPKMLQTALFVQIGVYFVLPLLLAIIHSVIGMRFAIYAMSMIIEEGVYWGVCVTAGLMLLLYSGYMFATFSGSKKIVGING